MLLFVTCLYSRLDNTEFGGRMARLARQTSSLEGLLQMKQSDFVCFTSLAELDMLQKHFHTQPNIRFIAYDLHSNPYQSRLRALQNPQKQKQCDRCQDIQYMKFSWHQELDLSKQSHVYWIDAGLSSQDLMSECKSDVWPRMETKLLEFPNEKILALGKENQNFFYAQWPRFFFQNKSQTHFVIGGLFGGTTQSFKDYCARMQGIIAAYLDKGFPDQEEMMMNVDQANHKDMYELLCFDIWEAHDPRAKTNMCFFDMMRKQNGMPLKRLGS